MDTPITPGRYRTRGGKTAVVEGVSVSGTHVFGSIDGSPRYWRTDGLVGQANNPCDNDLVERISDQTQSWRSRVIDIIASSELLETDSLKSGEFTIRILPYQRRAFSVTRGTEGIALSSPELFNAVCDRIKLLTEQVWRTEDDANAEAIERFLG